MAGRESEARLRADHDNGTFDPSEAYPSVGAKGWRCRNLNTQGLTQCFVQRGWECR